MTYAQFSIFVIAVGALSACATHDHQHANLLGGATAHNMQMQSVRDTSAPNPLAVESSEGGAPGRAVATLRDSSTRPAMSNGGER